MVVVGGGDLVIFVDIVISSRWDRPLRILSSSHNFKSKTLKGLRWKKNKPAG